MQHWIDSRLNRKGPARATRPSSTRLWRCDPEPFKSLSRLQKFGKSFAKSWHIRLKPEPGRLHCRPGAVFEPRSAAALVVPADSGLEPILAPRARAGCVLSIAFHLLASPGSIEFDVFLDGSGYLAGVDVAFNANSEPVPDDPQMLDSPYHIHGPLIREPSSD